jgi:hypothetical protein
MPPKAQQLLLDPFLAGEDVLRCNWYYEGNDDQLRMFAVVVAGPRTVTMATGSRYIPAGHSQTHAHWSLVCRRATVTRRTGH